MSSGEGLCRNEAEDPQYKVYTGVGSSLNRSDTFCSGFSLSCKTKTGIKACMVWELKHMPIHNSFIHSTIYSTLAYISTWIQWFVARCNENLLSAIKLNCQIIKSAINRLGQCISLCPVYMYVNMWRQHLKSCIYTSTIIVCWTVCIACFRSGSKLNGSLLLSLCSCPVFSVICSTARWPAWVVSTEVFGRTMS